MSKTLVERLRTRAPYYEEWARDIRNLNGASVDADHEDATARLLREAADAIEAAHKALAFLVELKNQKDAGFKTFVEEERYRALKPAAWERARIIVQGISRTHEDERSGG